jgi:hypothetical protein
VLPERAILVVVGKQAEIRLGGAKATGPAGKESRR